MTEGVTDKLPMVVRVYIWLFAALLAATLIAWGLDIVHERMNGVREHHHLYPLFVDGFKVALGAVIGVLSQWATTVFEKRSEQKG